MKNKLTCVLTLLVLAVAPACATAGQPDFVQGEILVKFKPGTSANAQASVHAANKAKVLQSIRGLGVQLVTAPKGSETAQCKRYKANKQVAYAEPNFISHVMDTVPNDPYFATDQWDMVKIQAPAAWDITAGSASVIVAVIDTGVDYNHPDLVGQTVPGYDFYSSDNDPMDEYGHGTDCAGIIGAIGNNGMGGAGVAWGCALMPLKVGGPTGSMPNSCVASALQYAADHSARVCSLSLGGSSYSQTMQDAVNYAYQKGCVIVAASGNGSTSSVTYPAAYDNVIAVGATDQSDLRCSYSNYGTALDIVAPGYGFCTALGGGYEGMNGTSSATPHVAGAAALLLSIHPELTPAQVTQILLSSADDVNTPGWDQETGYGRLNIYSALNAPVPAPLADTTAPTVSITSPTSGATALGTATVTSSTSDNTGVTAVDYYCDGTLIASATGSGSIQWNTSAVADGSHTLVAKARDAAGNVGQSAPVSVTVKNAYSLTQSFSSTSTTKSAKSFNFTTTQTANITATLTWSGSTTFQLMAYSPSGALLGSISAAASPITMSLPSSPAGNYHFDVRANANKVKFTLTTKAQSN